MSSSEKREGAVPEGAVPDAYVTLKTRSEELAILLNEGREYRTVKGETIKIPPFDGVTEKRCIKHLLDFFLHHPKLLADVWEKGSKGKLGAGDLLTACISNVDIGMDAAQALAGIICDKDFKWAQKHLLLADVTAICTPFFQVESTVIKSVVIRTVLSRATK